MIELSGAHLLVVGVTTRALAASAARTGVRVTAIDAFADVDLHAVAEVIPVAGGPQRRFNPHWAVAAGAAVSADVVAYTANLENHPKAVARLALGRRLLGNSPAVLNRVRNPIQLMRALRRAGFPIPETRTRPPTGSHRVWLIKPRRSGGGHGIRLWTRRAEVPRSSYLQERIQGTPGSIVFAADGRDAVILGLSRQLVGDLRFGAHGFRYCGSVLAGSGQPVFPRQGELVAAASAMSSAVSREFGLVGLNGIDFIARRGMPYPIEVNPRYSASMELVERAHGLSMFALHADACQGRLPAPPAPPALAQGKAIVFARRNLMVGDDLRWVDSLADVPHPGERIGRGRPVCTVFAAATRPTACVRLLAKRAAEVYRRTGRRRKRAA
jgi:uncharacterized protein